jgi:hypothetical protein
MNKQHLSPAVPPKSYLLKRLADPATAAAYINAAASECAPLPIVQVRTCRDAERAVYGMHRVRRRVSRNAIV